MLYFCSDSIIRRRLYSFFVPFIFVVVVCCCCCWLGWFSFLAQTCTSTIHDTCDGHAWDGIVLDCYCGPIALGLLRNHIYHAHEAHSNLQYIHRWIMDMSEINRVPCNWALLTNTKIWRIIFARNIARLFATSSSCRWPLHRVHIMPQFTNRPFIVAPFTESFRTEMSFTIH